MDLNVEQKASLEKQIGVVTIFININYDAASPIISNSDPDFSILHNLNRHKTVKDVDTTIFYLLLLFKQRESS